MSQLFEQIRERHRRFQTTLSTDELTRAGQRLQLKKGQYFSLTNGNILLAIEGGISLCMAPMAMSDEDAGITKESLCFVTVGPNTLLGYVESYALDLPLFYYAECDVSVITFSRENFDDTFLHKNKQTRLHTMAMISFSTAYLLDIINERIGAQGYEMIRSLIYRYSTAEQDKGIKGVSLSAYIIRRSKLSRSYVFGILSALKTGGYINMTNGKLLSIEKPLPAKF